MGDIESTALMPTATEAERALEVERSAWYWENEVSRSETRAAHADYGFRRAKLATLKAEKDAKSVDDWLKIAEAWRSIAHI